MRTARILNITGIILFVISFLIGVPILVYLSIAFIITSVIYWRKKSKKVPEE